MMASIRQRRLVYLIFLFALLCTVTSLVMFALRQNVSLFYTPTELLTKNGAHGLIRVGGMVVPGSLHRSSKTLEVEFSLTDNHQTIQLHYQGILPDLFREGQGVVAKGVYHSLERRFEASEILAKHDEKYMPPEVQYAIREAK